MPYDEEIIENKAIIKLVGDIDLEKTEELRDQAMQTLFITMKRLNLICPKLITLIVQVFQ